MIEKRDRITILKNMLGQTDMDTSQNSFIHQAESAGAIELEIANKDLIEVSLKFDFWRLSGSELDEGVFQRTGILRREPTYAKGEVLFTGLRNTEIPLGTIVLADELEFITMKEATIIDNQVRVPVSAVLPGSSGNISSYQITELKKRTNQAITDVTNPEPFIGGKDLETDQELKQRCHDLMLYPPKSGNAYHYEEWVREVPEVFDCKAFRRWQNRATVRIVIAGHYGQLADEELIELVEQHLEDRQVVPFGADVLIESVKPKYLNLSFDLNLAPGYDLDSVKENIRANVTEYLANQLFRSKKLSYAEIGSIIFRTAGVKDYENLLINNGTRNVEVLDDEMGYIHNIEIREV